MSLSENAANDMTNANLYEKDSRPYYGGEPAASKTGEYNVSPKIYPEANNRYLGKSIYSLDQKPYYGTGRDYKVLSNAPVGMKSVPIELNELKNTFADPKNIKILENDLQKITAKESLNSIALSGKYFKDPAPYYDPSAEEKARKVADISQKISNMRYELSQDQKGPVFTEENFKVKTKIQNYANLNREATNEFIKKSYYYEPISKNPKEINPKLTVFNAGEKAETNKHNLVEVETTTENLGSKYVENTKFKYTEADVKDTSNVKDVVPQIVSNLKNEKANKVSNDVKVDRVQNVLYKKVEEKKVEVPKPKVDVAKKVEAPKAKVEEKRVEEKKVEAPKAKVEAPKAKVEAPKAKVEAPKKTEEKKVEETQIKFDGFMKLEAKLPEIDGPTPIFLEKRSRVVEEENIIFDGFKKNFAKADFE